MAGKLLNMSKVKQIIRLKENGVGLRTISRSVGVSRNTPPLLELSPTRKGNIVCWSRDQHRLVNRIRENFMYGLMKWALIVLYNCDFSGSNCFRAIRLYSTNQ